MEPRIIRQTASPGFTVRRPNSKYSESQTAYDNPAVQKESFDYSAKDDSKLRALLSDRLLPTCGTREELISRLEHSSIDYTSLLSLQITEMLKSRHVTMAAQGNKEYKIERLRINDKVSHNTGDSHSSTLYGRHSAFVMNLHDLKKEAEALTEGRYEDQTPPKLSALLKKRGLPASGTKSVMAKRLYNHERQAIAKRIEDREADLKVLEEKMEVDIGHFIGPNKLDQDSNQESRDVRALQERTAAPEPKMLVCDYDWKDSHWAGRTEREISTICRRRGMPGGGPKAAMLKWLDTGSIDYADMHAYCLETICRDRGIRYTSKAKKVDLVRLLEEADEAE